jgi:Flp pilus assembly protein TadD
MGTKPRIGRCAAPAFALAAWLSTTACTMKPSDIDRLSEPRPGPTSTEEVGTAGLTRLAKVAESQNGLIDTASIYRRVIEREPYAIEPRLKLGRALVRQGDLDGAERAFRSAKTLSPDSVDVQIGLAQVALARDRFEDAAAILNPVIERDPANVGALGGLGLAMDGLGRRVEAQAHYHTALRLEPKNPVIRNNLGLSLALSGQHDEAVKMLQQLADEPGEAQRRYRKTLDRVVAMKDAAAKTTKSP